VIKAFSSIELAIVIPLTSKQPKYSIFSVVKLLNGPAGLTTESYTLYHQIRTISIDRIIKKRVKLDGMDILKIHSVVIDTLEI